jgi:hypothetical protein
MNTTYEGAVAEYGCATESVGVKSKRILTYRPDVDGLRGVAVIESLVASRLLG